MIPNNPPADITDPASPLGHLESIGCRCCGEWQMSADRVRCTLIANAQAANVLYAFVCDKTVMYVGKTTQSLKARMNGYANPGPTQSTNIKGNAKIRELLLAGKTVEVYALPDNGLLRYGGFQEQTGYDVILPAISRSLSDLNGQAALQGDIAFLHLFHSKQFRLAAREMCSESDVSAISGESPTGS